MPYQSNQRSLHEEITQMTAPEDSSRTFLTDRNLLKQTLDCQTATSSTADELSSENLPTAPLQQTQSDLLLLQVRKYITSYILLSVMLYYVKVQYFNIQQAYRLYAVGHIGCTPLGVQVVRC